MTTNIINLNQHNELENRLKSDAERLNDQVSPQLRAQLFCQLSTQTIKDKPLTHSAHSFIKNKIAIAASFIFAIFIIQFIVTQQPVEEITTAANHSNHSINEILLSFSTELKTKDLLASQDLNNEYKAILADIEKVKRKIVTL